LISETAELSEFDKYFPMRTWREYTPGGRWVTLRSTHPTVLVQHILIKAFDISVKWDCYNLECIFNKIN